MNGFDKEVEEFLELLTQLHNRTRALAEILAKIDQRLDPTSPGAGSDQAESPKPPG